MIHFFCEGSSHVQHLFLVHPLFFWDGSIPSWDWRALLGCGNKVCESPDFSNEWGDNDRSVSMKTINHDVLIPEVFRLEIFNYSDSSLKSSIVIFV